MDRLRILLLQARLPEDVMAEHEVRCFAARCGLGVEQFEVHSLVEGPPDAARLKRCDALMVGGAGDFYVSRGDLPRFDDVIAFFGSVVSDGPPTFASCFGYHCLVLALGGEIRFDPDNTEVGTFELTLSPEGRSDPLFGILPASFQAQEGHKDRAVRYPEGVPNLAASTRSPMQALRIPDKPVWATQFHPELDRRANLDRFEHYLDGYAAYMTAAQRSATRARFRHSPDTDALLPRFLAHVFG